MYRIAARTRFYFAEYFELCENKIIHFCGARVEEAERIHAVFHHIIYTFATRALRACSRFWLRDGSPQNRLNQPFDITLCKCMLLYFVFIYVQRNASRKKFF